MINHNIEQSVLEAAALAIDEEIHICAEWDELTTSSDSVEDFISAQGKPRWVHDAENGMKVYEWAIGKRTLAVIDLGEVRASLLM